MVYGRNAILEVQPDEIVYTTDYQKQVSISLTIYVLFGSVHTCYTFHTAFQVRKRKVLKDKGPKVTKKVSKKRNRLDESSDESNNHDQESDDESNNHDQFSRAGIDR